MLNPLDKKQCRNDSCRTDCYDPTLSECVEFLVHGTCSRIESYNNINLQKAELMKLKKITRAFNINKCFFGTNHLWFDDQKVLMVKQAYQFTQKVHGEEHLTGSKMITKIRQFSIYLPPLFDFINQFPSYCPICLSKGIKPVKCMSPIWKILQSKFYMNLNQIPRQESITDLISNIEVDFCPKNTCTMDEYDRDNQICVYFIINDRFPPLPKGEGANSNRRRLKKKAMLLRVQKCNQGTLHLWVKGHNTRIPMKRQAENLARLLHGDRAHRCKRVMMDIISQQKKIYYHEVEDAIKKIVNQCLFCNPKTTDPHHDSSDSEGYRRTLAYKSKTIPLGRMGKAERTECARQVMQNENLRQKFGRIKMILDRITIWEEARSFVKEIMRLQNVSEIAAQIAIQNLHWSRAQDDDIDETMDSIPQVIYRTYREDKIKKVIFVCTKTMKYHYLRYGDSLCIDYVTGCIRSREASGRHFLVGFFTGQNSQGNIVLFGLTLISTELSLYHMKSFQLFFNAMGGEHLPGAIITPDSRPLYLSLDIIKSRHSYEYDNFMNWFYVVEFLKKNSVNELEKQKILNMFCQSFTEPVQARYTQIMHSIRSQMVSTSIYRQIEKFGEKFCLCRISPKFVGFGLTTKRVEGLYEILEKKMEYQPKMSSFFSNLFQMQKHLWDNYKIVPDNSANQKSLKYPELQQFTKILHEKIFNQLQDHYAYQVQNITVKEQKNGKKPELSNPAIIRLEDKLTKCIYTVKYFCADMCWKCNCRLGYFLGIPCSHLIKVVLMYGGHLKYYINSRWIVQEKDEEYQRLYENRGLATEYKKQGVGMSDYMKLEEQMNKHYVHNSQKMENWQDQEIMMGPYSGYQYDNTPSESRHHHSGSYSRMSMTGMRKSNMMKSRQKSENSMNSYQKLMEYSQQKVPRFTNLYNEALKQNGNAVDDDSEEDFAEAENYKNLEQFQHAMSRANEIQEEANRKVNQFGLELGRQAMAIQEEADSNEVNLIKEQNQQIMEIVPKVQGQNKENLSKDSEVKQQIEEERDSQSQQNQVKENPEQIINLKQQPPQD